jgi:hypothetical protein
VNFIEFEWQLQSPAELQGEDEISVWRSLDYHKIFKAKYNWLYSFLKQKLGDPVNIGDKNSYPKWKNGKQRIELINRQLSTHLRLYNDQE